MHGAYCINKHIWSLDKIQRNFVWLRPRDVKFLHANGNKVWKRVWFGVRNGTGRKWVVDGVSVTASRHGGTGRDPSWHVELSVSSGQSPGSTPQLSPLADSPRLIGLNPVFYIIYVLLHFEIFYLLEYLYNSLPWICFFMYKYNSNLVFSEAIEIIITYVSKIFKE